MWFAIGLMVGTVVMMGAALARESYRDGKAGRTSEMVLGRHCMCRVSP